MLGRLPGARKRQPGLLYRAIADAILGIFFLLFDLYVVPQDYTVFIVFFAFCTGGLFYWSVHYLERWRKSG